MLVKSGNVFEEERKREIKIMKDEGKFDKYKKRAGFVLRMRKFNKKEFLYCGI
jgi:hypothetical protein